MTFFRRRRGFTLIEILFAFALLTVSTFMMYQLLTRGSATAVSGIWRGRVCGWSGRPLATAMWSSGCAKAVSTWVANNPAIS